MRAQHLDSSHREIAGSDEPRRRTGRLAVVGVVIVLSLTVAVAAMITRGDDPHRSGSQPLAPGTTDSGSQPAPTVVATPYRAFKANSWWNHPVPVNAPHNPHELGILDYLRTAPDSGDGCLRLAGAHQNPWGDPVYWARPGDTRYDVTGVTSQRPPELVGLRIPAGARPADNSDGTMSIFDREAGYVTLLTDAQYDASSDRWTASGATVTYLGSNGLDVRTGRSDEPRNRGTHRGNNGADSVVRLDMVQAGLLDHVLKVSSGPELSSRWVYPMTGSDGDGPVDDPVVPPEGLRLRIKPSVQLDTLGLHPQALVIARALQTYGMYLGDSGGSTAVKLEDTTVEGRGQLWDVSSEDLCGLPFTSAYWDVLPEGYDPSATAN